MNMPSLHRHPAWFGSVMGTAAVALSVHQLASVFTTARQPLEIIARVLVLIASVLAVILTPRYLTRSRDRAALAHEIADPAHGAMLATFPAGLLVLAVAWGRVGDGVIGTRAALIVSAVLVIAGALMAIGMSVVWASAQGRGDADLAGVNGGWLIPPVMSLIVPLALAPQLIEHPSQAAWLFAVALGFYGVGLFLFLALFALLIARLALRPPIPHAMSPSLWIPLAPAGIMGLALLRLLEAGVAVEILPAEAVSLGVVVSGLGIGLGLWWALFAIGDLVRVRRAGGVPFHPGWWGFVFPIAAMQLSITALGLTLDSAVVIAAGVLGFVFLVSVWLLIAVRTVTATIRHRALS